MLPVERILYADLRWRSYKHNKNRTRNGGPTMMVGDRVRLVTPDNPRMDGTVGTIQSTTNWGAHLVAPAAATGHFRALWNEMEADVAYVGDCCMHCGSIRMKRTGMCKTCEDCGESGGCG